jgi:hypothetical protein
MYAAGRRPHKSANARCAAIEWLARVIERTIQTAATD